MEWFIVVICLGFFSVFFMQLGKLVETLMEIRSLLQNQEHSQELENLKEQVTAIHHILLQRLPTKDYP